MTEFSIRRVGTSLAALGVVTYFLCLLWDLIVPAAAMRSAWGAFLPGFYWSPGGILLGAVEVVVYGYYAAAVFGATYNVLGRRAQPLRSQATRSSLQ